MTPKEFCRPNPEDLLRQIQKQERSEARGRLKIFLGYAPRVGKSVRMFEEGVRRLQRGQDVVVGAIQDKGAQHLEAMLRELEVIELSGVLARHPQVCLIDELARENPGGSRNRHRWQDVEEILAAGITVVCAINLQHIFEEQDAVQRVTGKRAANSVPASFIHSADELVIVDVPAEEVARPGDRGDLTEAQLSELRELALLRAAQVVEEQLQRYLDSHGIRQSWSTQERILVCLTPRSNARAMLESAARTTQRFHGQMIAIYVKQGGLTEDEEEILKDNLACARQMGALVKILEGSDAIARILQFAHDERITQLFIGHTRRKAWTFWPKNPVDRLIAAAEGIDIRLFPSEVKENLAA